MKKERFSVPLITASNRPPAQTTCYHLVNQVWSRIIQVVTCVNVLPAICCRRTGIAKVSLKWWKCVLPVCFTDDRVFIWLQLFHLVEFTQHLAKYFFHANCRTWPGGKLQLMFLDFNEYFQLSLWTGDFKNLKNSCKK